MRVTKSVGSKVKTKDKEKTTETRNFNLDPQ